MAKIYNFEGENGVLSKYTGEDSVISIPPSFREIGKYIIRGNNNITTINIPSSIEKIDELSFCYSDNLKNINVSEDNLYYYSENGVLYSKDKKTLLTAPKGIEDDFKIPIFVKEIGKDAFTGCKNITKLTIPHNVTSISFNAFAACNNLKEIYISESVNEIGNDAFIDCSSLTIYGKLGSYAEFFSQINNIPFIKIEE